MCFGLSQYWLADFWPVEYSTGRKTAINHNSKYQKLHFWNFIKIDLNALRYRTGVQNDSKTPQGPISGHISSSRPISATLSKFEFLAKIDFLANFGIFDFLKYDLPFGRKWPKI